MLPLAFGPVGYTHGPFQFLVEGSETATGQLRGRIVLRQRPITQIFERTDRSEKRRIGATKEPTGW